MRTLALAVLFLVAPCAALAAPAVSQHGNQPTQGTGNQLVTVGASAPGNGDIVSIMVTGATGGPTSITDSNSVALTLRKQVNQGASRQISLYDYVVSGSPTKTYSCTINSASSCALMGAIDVTGVGAESSITATGTASSPNSGAITTIVGDVVYCGITSNNAQTIAISNSSGLTSVIATGTTVLQDASYAIATGTTSTCTGSASASWAVAVVDYTPAVPTKGCPPFPYACHFQGAYNERIVGYYW